MFTSNTVNFGHLNDFIGLFSMTGIIIFTVIWLKCSRFVKNLRFLNIYTSMHDQVCQSKFSKIFLQHVMYELENGVVNIQNWIRNLKIIIPFFKVFRAEEVIQVKHILYNLFKITACIIKFWRRHLRYLDFISYIINDRF